MGRRNQLKCPHCKSFFIPSPRSAGRQRYCSDTICQKASKAASQRKWLSKAENRDYFRGLDNVRRVQRWRKANPDYGRRTPVQPAQREDTLQDPLIEKDEQEQSTRCHFGGIALQDSLTDQDFVLLGLIANFIGSSLQDDIALTTGRLRQLGVDILNDAIGHKGGQNDSQSPPISPESPPGPQTVQLDRPSLGP